jgi:hypothetical protein
MHSLRKIFALNALALCLASSSLLAQGTTTGTTTTTTTTNAGIATIGGTTATTSTGPIAVWRLTFQQTGDSINYRPYQGGYYVAPVEGGAGTLILTLVTGGLKQYFTYSAFGDVFVAVKGTTKKMVLSATAASSVSTTTFYGIGTADYEINLDSRNVTGKVLVASKMTGYAVSADSEQDLPFAGSATSVGVAGASILTAKLDTTLTHAGNNKNNDVTGEVTDLQAILATGGYTDGKAATNPNVK